MKFFLSILSLVFFFNHTYTQTKDSINVILQPMVVTATRIPQLSLYVNRSLDVIDNTLLNNGDASSFTDALQKGANIHAQPRGVFGMQSDISIRGSLFGQNLILLNGIRFNDPQTGHHNSDIPLPLDQIERIEILKTPASAQYGADAYGGIINFISKQPTAEHAWLRVGGGEYGLVTTTASLTTMLPSFASSNTIEHNRSNGYHFDTDFQTTTFLSNNTIDVFRKNISVIGGYEKKEFGAFDFYSPGANAESREWTETFFANVATDITNSSFSLSPKIFYKKHNDRFSYKPTLPENSHTTHLYGGEVTAAIHLGESTSLVSGIEFNGDNITSTKLGDHTRTSFGAHSTVTTLFENIISFDAGIRADTYSDYSTQLNPNAGMGFLFSSSGKIFVTAGRSFRLPSYTELYYSDPSTNGNTNLKPEIGWSYEIGAEEKLTEHITTAASVFRRDQQNLIDYVKYTSADLKFFAVNYTQVTTNGAEVSLRWNNLRAKDKTGIAYFSLAYTYLDSKVDRGNVVASRYSLTHPKHQLTSSVTTVAPFGIATSFTITHKEKLDGNTFTLFDTKISKSFFVFEFFLHGTNLFNTSYEEIRGVPMPGRWLWAEIEYNIF